MKLWLLEDPELHGKIWEILMGNSNLEAWPDDSLAYACFLHTLAHQNVQHSLVERWRTLPPIDCESVVFRLVQQAIGISQGMVTPQKLTLMVSQKPPYRIGLTRLDTWGSNGGIEYLSVSLNCPESTQEVNWACQKLKFGSTLLETQRINPESGRKEIPRYEVIGVWVASFFETNEHFGAAPSENCTDALMA